MIANLKGKLTHKSPVEIVVDVNGATFAVGTMVYRYSTFLF